MQMKTATTILPPPAPPPFPAPVAIPAGAGSRFDLGGLGINWKIDGIHTGGRFSVVHHPLAPKALAAPLHRHHREDEYSYVVAGTLARCWVTTWSRLGPGLGYSNREGNGTPFGMQVTRQVKYRSDFPRGFEEYFRELASI